MLKCTAPAVSKTLPQRPLSRRHDGRPGTPSPTHHPLGYTHRNMSCLYEHAPSAKWGCRVDLKIGVVSKLSGFSPSGIRYFEERGIVSPSHGRDGTYRSFDLPDVARLLECRNYRECGCDTAEIAALLSHGSLCDVVAGLYVAGVDGDFWSTPCSCNGFALASGVLAGSTAAKDLVA